MTDPESRADLPAVTVGAAIVLAAGEGTRMRSTTPKVLHEICGRSLLGHVLTAVAGANPQRIAVVTGHQREAVEAHLRDNVPDAIPVFQPSQNGTGHAVRLALAELDAVAARAGEGPIQGTVVVAAGDTPLLSAASVRALAEHRARTHAPGVLLTAHLPNPAGYGRVVRDRWSRVKEIVEHADATEAQLKVTEINSGVYAFDAAKLRVALARLTTDNAQGEEYLPDVVRLLVDSAEPVGAALLDDWHEVAGVNDRAQLAQARAWLRDRLLLAAMRHGVTVFDPATTWVDVGVTLEPDAVVLPNTMLLGSTRVARGARVGPNCSLTDTVVHEGAVVRDATCEGAEIGPEASVGPYTFLRPGTVLGRGARAGGFVEMKNARVGADSKVPHLSYVGDATIGERSNIGAATIFANYDGVEKHATVVGDDVRVGSDTMLVAPVVVGDGAYTAAGSVIVEDVPPGALAVARGHQRNVEGWVEKKRPNTASASAAGRARARGSGKAASNSASGDDRDGESRHNGAPEHSANGE